MRCIALAQAWTDEGGEAMFVCSPLPLGLESRLSEEGFDSFRQDRIPGSIDDAVCVEGIVGRFDPDWIVCDGYCFGTEYQSRLRGTGAKLLLIDDFAPLAEYDTDAILNQNLGAVRYEYRSRSPIAERLNGPRFAMLRREFQDPLPPVRQAPGFAKRAIVTMGGSDPANVTTRVLNAVGQTRSFDRLSELDVLIGPANRRGDEIERTCQTLSQTSSVRVTALRQPPSMRSFLSSSDFAISAAGTTSWELACLGVPALILVSAENQRDVARDIDEAGFGINAGDLSSGSTELERAFERLVSSGTLREEMANTARTFVDGRGASRVTEFLSRRTLLVRDVLPSESALLLEWANDPEVRRQSFSMEPITPEAHESWFRRKLADPLCRIYVGTDGGEPVGQVRFEALDERNVEIGISVAASARGRRVGRAMLLRAIRRLFRESAFETVLARVKSGNAGSRRLFEGAGFAATRDPALADGSLRYILQRTHAV